MANTESSVQSMEAVQVVSLQDHLFQLKLKELKNILGAEEIKDRYVVVVSIAGAYRKGKSFLLNFFIKYLNAQYKRRKVSDWLRDKDTDVNFKGFKWRGGRKPVTSGIWIWSDIFIHDFENGDKIAIVLLDTQGIFDHQSTQKECTTIFALSTMLSSVQCYNVMHDIQEDNLQHLELFCEYGRLAMEQTNEKSFQKLLFIIRDWQHAHETGFGFNSEIIDEIFTANDERTDEMRRLRMRIQTNFDGIEAFLMPSPGRAVSEGSFRDNLDDIDSEFLKYIEEFIPSLFAPENLTIKTINGRKIRASDLVQYWDTFLNILKSDKLPEPISMWMAIVETTCLIQYEECVQHYITKMEQQLQDDKSILTDEDLRKLHIQIQEETKSMFEEGVLKIGDDQVISSFICQIEDNTGEKFRDFNHRNNNKRKSYIDELGLLCRAAKAEFESNFRKKIGNKIWKDADLKKIFDEYVMIALEELNSKKRDNGDIFNEVMKDLENDLNTFKSTIENLNKENETNKMNEMGKVVVASATIGAISSFTQIGYTALASRVMGAFATSAAAPLVVASEESMKSGVGQRVASAFIAAGSKVTNIFK